MVLALDDAVLLLVAAAAGLGVAALAYGTARVGLRIAARTENTLDDKLAGALRLPLSAFAGVIASAVVLVVLQDRIADSAIDQSRRLLVGIFLALGMWGLIRVLRAFLDRAGERHTRFLPAARVGSRLVAVALYSMAFLMILSVYGVSVTPVLTGLGIAGLAVALALQDTGANFFAGLWIQTGRALQPGHYVKLESEKLEGYVAEVGWRVTTLRTLGGNAIVVPNNKLAQAITTDYNLPDPTFSVSLSFRVGFEADPDLVLRCLTEEARAVTKQLPGIVPGEPFAQLADISPDATVYSVSLRVKEFVEQYAALRELRIRVLRRFQKEEIRMPYPAQHILNEVVDAPKAKRKPSGPGGFAPGRRPPRPKAKAVQHDPVVEEANRAKQEIEAKQREKADAADGAHTGQAEARATATAATSGAQADAAAAARTGPTDEAVQARAAKPAPAAGKAEQPEDGGRPQSGEPKDATSALKPAR